MRRILIALALIFMATTASAGLISNHSTGMTGEDSLVTVIYNLDSLSQPLGGLDTLKVLVMGPSGDSVFAEVLSAISGRLSLRSTGAGKYDTTYVYKAQVSDIDGGGTAGVYTIRFTTVSNETGAWLRFQKFEQFQVAGTRYSSLASATTLDSAEVYQAARQALISYNADSTIRSDTLIAALLDSLKDRDSLLFSDDYWTALVGVVAHAVWDATMSGHSTTGTTGDFLDFAGDPNNYPTLTEMNDSTWGLGTRTVASVAGAVGSVTGNVGGNVTGSVGSVVGAVGSVTGNVGGNVVGNVNGNVVGFIGGIVSDIAEQIAAVTEDSIGTLQGGASSTSLNEILNPYFNLKGTDTVSFPTAAYSIDSSVIPGWRVNGYSVGSGEDNYVSIEANPYAVESTLTAGRMMVLKVQQTMTSGQMDSILVFSNPIKLFPGVYKFGIRHFTQTVSAGGTSLDSVVVDLLPFNSATRVAGFTVPLSSSWKADAGHYVATDTSTVWLKIKVFGYRQTAPTEPAEWIAISHAFVTNLGHNPWAIAAATARAIANSVGDSLQKAQSVNVDIDEAAIAAAVWNSTMASYLNAGSVGLTIRDGYLASIAVKDSMQLPNGPQVNVKAISNNTQAAYAMNLIYDSIAGPKAIMEMNQLSVSAPPSGEAAVSFVSDGSTPAFQAINATDAAGPAVLFGGAGGVKFYGSATGAPGLTVDGQSTSPDVAGTFPTDATVDLGDVTVNCGGSGDNLVRIYARDTSGTDEYIPDVLITIRYLSNMVEEAKTHTLEGGYYEFSLPDGTFIVLSRKAGYMLAPDTIVVAGSGSHYVDGYNTNRLNICTVYGYVTGLPRSGALAKITVSMPDKVSNTCDSTILATNTMEVNTSADGYFEFDVPYSSCFGGAKYVVTVTPSSGIIQTGKFKLKPTSPSKSYPIQVPSQSSYRVVF